MRKTLFFLAFFTVIVSTTVVAQGCDPMFDSFCDETDIPLDGGTSVLLGLATIYGVKKLRSRRPE